MIIYFSGPDDMLFEVHYKCHVEKWAAIDIYTFPQKTLKVQTIFSYIYHFDIFCRQFSFNYL